MAPKATADDVLEERVLQKHAQLKGRVRAAGRLFHVLSLVMEQASLSSSASEVCRTSVLRHHHRDLTSSGDSGITAAEFVLSKLSWEFSLASPGSLSPSIFIVPEEAIDALLSETSWK